MLTAPIFSSRSIPVQIRVLITLILSLLVTPLHLGTAEVDPANLIQFVSKIAIETTVGATLGLGVMLILSGVQLAGELISQISGSRMGDSFNPTFNESVAIFSQLLDLVTMAVFLIIGGHRMMMDSLLDTFRSLPPGKAFIESGILDTIIDLTTQSFVFGIRASAPAVVALMLSQLVMGLISRTLPQLNVLVIGFNLNAMITLGVLAFSIGMIALLFQDGIEPALEQIRQLYHVSQAS